MSAPGRVRRGLPALAAGLVVLAAAGCTVPVAGVTGVGVDEQGQPVGYLAVCEEHVDGATLYFDGDAAASDEEVGSLEVDSGMWVSGEAVTVGSSWSMAEPTSGWEARGTFREVMPGKTYHLYAWTHDNSWSTAAVRFTAEDLGRLHPGEVLTNDYDPATDAETVVVQDEAEFYAEQCADWGGRS